MQQMVVLSKQRQTNFKQKEMVLKKTNLQQYRTPQVSKGNTANRDKKLPNDRIVKLFVLPHRKWS